MKKENIINLIKNDHKALKEGIQILISDNSKPSQKKSALRKFLVDLKLHSKTEEVSLYDNVVDLKEVHESILEGYEEHSVADMLSDELEGLEFENNFTDELQAKAKVLADLVKHHIQEEEEKTFVHLKKALSEEELENLGKIYQITFRAYSSEFSDERTRIKPVSQVEASRVH